MLELHLFVNPLGMQCYHCEQDVLRIEKELAATKLNYQFVPLINMQTTENTLQRYQLGPDKRAVVSRLLYQVSLDYKAALFQGGKRGRRYLLQMQTELIANQRPYSPELVEAVAIDAKLDREMFLADRTSSLARQALAADQKMASELDVTNTATAVIFDTTGPDFGVLVPDFHYGSLIECLQNPQLDLTASPQEFAAQLAKHHPQLRVLAGGKS